MKRQQSTTTDNTTRSEPTPEQALTQLQAALLTLKNSGDEGFEGLAAALLSAATGMTFRLAISGTQDGQDGRGDQRDGAISFEAKLFRRAHFMAKPESDKGIDPFQISGSVEGYRFLHIDLHCPRNGNVLARPEALIDHMLQQPGSARSWVETAISENLR